MTLSHIILAFFLIGALLTGATWIDWSPALTTWDTFAVRLAGTLLPVWDPIERLLF